MPHMSHGFNKYPDRGPDPNRAVQRSAMPGSLASRLHYQEGKSAQDLFDMTDDEWSGLSKGLVSRDEVADYMRAYEHYQQ
jgi:hypothetical protein